MKKVLFIDRDGTLILEPPEECQVNSLVDLEFIPGVIRALYQITTGLDYELVMVTNQDGLGTAGYPQETFDLVQQKLLRTFSGEGINFSSIHVDNSFEHENSPYRKPRTGLLKKYINGDYDLENSFVIGDRLSDLQLAKNLKAKGILVRNAKNNKLKIPAELIPTAVLVAKHWDEIYSFLKSPQRKITLSRKTKETDISVELNLDGKGESVIATGLGFFDHLLEQIPKHGNIDLKIRVHGDLHVDEHHSIEDTGIVLGEAFAKALSNKVGIERYGFCLPMDDCLAQVVIDFGGRSWIIWEAEFKREKIGEVPAEMFFHFFKSFSDAAKCNLNIKAEGQNEHHKIEAIFKAFAKSVKMAVKKDACNINVPSTKGVI